MTTTGDLNVRADEFVPRRQVPAVVVRVEDLVDFYTVPALKNKDSDSTLRKKTNQAST